MNEMISKVLESLTKISVMLKKIIKILNDPHHICHKSQFYGPLLVVAASCIIIPAIALWIPYREQVNKERFEAKRMKQDTLILFSKAITKTVNYAVTMGDAECRAENETDSGRKAYLKNLSDKYYDNLNSIDPQYEAACTISKIYFKKSLEKDFSELKTLLDKLLTTQYKKIVENKCVESKEFSEAEKTVIDKYTKLLDKLLIDIKN